MPRTSLPSGLATHLQGEVLTLATLWKLTTVDNEVFGATSHVRNIEYDGDTYYADLGMSPTALKIGLGGGIDNMAVSLLFTSAGIQESDLRGRKFDGATLDVMVLNYETVADGAGKLMRGRLGNVTIRQGGFEVECRGLLQHSRQMVGWITSPECRWLEFGGTECGFALTTNTGTVTSRTSDRVFRASALSGDGDDFYSYGIIAFTSGLNNGIRAEVKKFTDATQEIELQLEMPFTVAIGDTFSIKEGCDRLWPTCKAKGNAARFGGEPHVPGLDAVLRRPPN